MASLSTEERTALWTERLYKLVLDTDAARYDYEVFFATGGDRDYFFEVFPTLLEIARLGPSGRAQQFIFDLHKDSTALPFYIAAQLWREMPDLSPEDRADAEALTAILIWFDGGGLALLGRPSKTRH